MIARGRIFYPALQVGFQLQAFLKILFKLLTVEHSADALQSFFGFSKFQIELRHQLRVLTGNNKFKLKELPLDVFDLSGQLLHEAHKLALSICAMAFAKQSRRGADN